MHNALLFQLTDCIIYVGKFGVTLVVTLVQTQVPELQIQSSRSNLRTSAAPKDREVHYQQPSICERSGNFWTAPLFWSSRRHTRPEETNSPKTSCWPSTSFRTITWFSLTKIRKSVFFLLLEALPNVIASIVLYIRILRCAIL